MTATESGPAPATGPTAFWRRLRSPWGLGGVAVVVVVVFVAVGVLRAPGRLDVFLEPAAALGPEPFMTLDGVVDLRVGQELLLDLGGGVTLRIGTEPGLYGGSGSDHVCDPDLIAEFLESEPEKAAAWADVQDIEVDEIPEFLDGLTPVVLLADTLVTNHGFRDGRATARRSVLQAGTMVLVDDTGVPRVRCKCGNPLLPPRLPGDLGRLDYVGEPWDGFDEDGLLEVEPGDVVDAFLLVRLSDGQLIARPVGTTGEADVLVDEDGNWIPELDLGLPSSAALDDGPFPLPEESSAELPVVYDFDGPCRRRSDGDLELTGAGRCTVNASSEASEPWAALEIVHVMEIALRAQEIVFPPLDRVVVGEDPMPIDATADSLLPVAYGVEGPCTVSGGAVAADGPGPCTLTMAQGGDEVWAEAEPLSVELEAVEGEPRADQEMTFDLPESMRLGAEPLPLEASASSGGPVDFLVAGPCEIVDGALTPASVGICAVIAAQAGDDEFRRVTRIEKITIERQVQTIGLEALPPFVAPDDPPLPLPAETSAGVEVAYEVSGPCELGDDGLVFTGEEGTCRVTGKAGGDDETEPVEETAEIEVSIGAGERQPQSIAFAGPGALTFGGGSVSLSGSATSGLPVVFTVTSGGCSVRGRRLSPGGAGSCTVVASQPGDEEWLPADRVTRRVTVRKATPGINVTGTTPFPANATQAVGATATSGPAPSISLVGGPCTLAGALLTPSAAGTCTIRAATPGDANHEPVAVDVGIQVNLATQSITISGLPGSLAIGQSVSIAVTATSGLPAQVTAGPGSVCTLDGAVLTGAGEGSCTVSASQTGSGVFASATQSAAVPVVKQAHTIDIQVPTTIFVNDSAKYVVVSSAGLPVAVTPSGGRACGFDPVGSADGVVVGRTAGTCTISASSPGTAAIQAASATVTINVVRRPEVIQLAVNDFPAGSSSQVSATTASGLPVSLSATGPCGLDGSVVFSNTVGTCTITATTAGNGAFEPGSAQRTVNVTPGAVIG